jgi:hypothetical protein
MSRVGIRRERERVVPRATGVPRLAKPARQAWDAHDGDLELRVAAETRREPRHGIQRGGRFST